ncbi:hypothetical protein SAMN05519103_01952 [Rhizobiales bacterium GAS113]|nr:hypothetical protein SAMN05519103_01952 [Rhizobiales bacterium GAS113]
MQDKVVTLVTRRDREADELFLDIWRREWRAELTREQCEADIAFMLAHRSPGCASVARRDLAREARAKG